GGQAQRIAIARALAAEPDILLLDEPFAALDVAVAPTLRRMLRRVLAARTAIVVTHEVLDALTLADRVIVMNLGRIVETGATAEVLDHPRHPFTAELAGLNLLSGTGTATGLRTPDGLELTCRPLDGEVFAAFRPTAVTVHRDRPTAANVFRSAALDLEPRGDLVRVRAGGLFADLSPGLAASLDLEPGGEAWFSVDPDDIAAYPS
ncbi:MAG TPA: ATP-binding cassette domain-containing protein, partial [Lacisediminihabitans sp.]|uniref:ATP-binding cassette domain-containing protein n=1 Tax=Lacisediminihabitans sp. TaxID=2787631 RepID=UPI002ED7EBD3